MTNITELENQLIKNKMMRSYEEIALYEEALDSLFDKENPDSINSLIKGFADDTEHHEVMYSNLHGIEYFSKTLGMNNYIDLLIPNLKHLQSDAYDWSETFFLRLLNNQKSYDVVLKSLDSLNKEDKIIIEKITKNLVDRNPKRFKDRGLEILSLI